MRPKVLAIGSDFIGFLEQGGTRDSGCDGEKSSDVCFGGTNGPTKEGRGGRHRQTLNGTLHGAS